MGRGDTDEAAFMELSSDSWHQVDEGGYAIDCPECGSKASLMGVVEHGRCNGFLDRQEEGEDAGTDCTAKLWFELGYKSEPAESDAGEGGRTAAGSSDEGDDDIDDKHDKPPGTDGTVDADSQ
ncbi:hypothetical protein [Natronosalvus vescus]|uniref:hypothetical protein n=1 Tax=Natronosalvus vescus TaxID=2953881 RepID=UPI00209020F9|nr:hypothetical protein [Natronosalvus vescus]